MPDRIKIEILEDGTVSYETDAISGRNHVSADDFLKLSEKLTGAKIAEKQRQGFKTHTHLDGITHSH